MCFRMLQLLLGLALSALENQRRRFSKHHQSRALLPPPPSSHTFFFAFSLSQLVSNKWGETEEKTGKEGTVSCAKFSTKMCIIQMKVERSFFAKRSFSLEKHPSPPSHPKHPFSQHHPLSSHQSRDALSDEQILEEQRKTDKNKTAQNCTVLYFLLDKGCSRTLWKNSVFLFSMHKMSTCKSPDKSSHSRKKGSLSFPAEIRVSRVRGEGY